MTKNSIAPCAKRARPVDGEPRPWARRRTNLLLSCPCARLAGPSGSAFLFQRLALRQLRISSSAQR